MVEFFGKTVRSEARDDMQIIEFEIPAFSKRTARRRALVNGRIKNIGNREVLRNEAVRSGQVPGQSIYSVVVGGEVEA